MSDNTTGIFDYCHRCNTPRWSPTDPLCECKESEAKLQELNNKALERGVRLAEARFEIDQLRTRLAEVEGERDRLLGWKEEALVVLCEHFEAFHSILAGEGVLGATIGSEAARVDAARRAELSKLRPVVEAARGLTRLSEWWVTSDHDGGMFCITCDFSLSHGEHDPDCPAIALEQALAALDAGEGDGHESELAPLVLAIRDEVLSGRQPTQTLEEVARMLGVDLGEGE